jgi:flagellar protein FlaG
MSIEMSMSTSDVNKTNNQTSGASNHSYQHLNTVTPSQQVVSKELPAQEEVKALEKAEEVSPKSELNKEQLEIMAQKLQEFVGSLNKGLEFSVDEDSGRDVIKVIDKSSGDTVRQYPSEEVLDLVASLSDAAGTFVNIKA